MSSLVRTVRDLGIMIAAAQDLSTSVDALLDTELADDALARNELNSILTALTTWFERMEGFLDGIAERYGAATLPPPLQLTANEDSTATAIENELNSIQNRVIALQAEAAAAAAAGVTLAGFPEQQPDEPDDIYEARVAAWGLGHPVDANAIIEQLPTSVKVGVKVYAGLWEAITGREWETDAQRAAAGLKQGAAAAITQMYGATTFAAFIMEEALQSVNLGAWVAYGAEEYDTSETTLDMSTKLLDDYWRILELMRPLMPMTYPAFKRFGDATMYSIAAIRSAIARKRAGQPAPTTGTLSLKSSPTNAEITLDGQPTGLLTPETFTKVPPGAHTIVLTLPATKKRGAMRAETTVNIFAGKKAELLVPLTEVT